MHIKKIIFAIMVAVCVAVAGTVYVVNDRTSDENTTDTWENSIEQTYVVQSSEAVLENDTASAYIYVYVCGNVNSPGIVQLNEGARVYEAVELAGGMSDTADINAVNQAECVTDGQKIYIPSEGESISYSDGWDSDASDDSNGKININTADLEKLITLPGIGETRAQAIIDYRNSVGLFNDITEIMNVSGIKESSFEKIKDYIMV